MGIPNDDRIRRAVVQRIPEKRLGRNFSALVGEQRRPEACENESEEQDASDGGIHGTGLVAEFPNGDLAEDGYARRQPFVIRR